MFSTFIINSNPKFYLGFFYFKNILSIKISPFSYLKKYPYKNSCRLKLISIFVSLNK